MSHRNEKIASTLMRAVQQVLVEGLHDPRTHGVMMTVTAVDLAPDGRNATVSVSVLPESKEARVLGALVHSAAHIRRETAEKMHLKIMPLLSFTIDKSLKRQAGVIQALGQVAAEREQADEQSTSDATPDDDTPQQQEPPSVQR